MNAHCLLVMYCKWWAYCIHNLYNVMMKMLKLINMYVQDASLNKYNLTEQIPENSKFQ